MLVGFFIGAFVGSFAGGWFALFGGCLGAMLALTGKSERVLTPDEAREQRREAAKRRKAKARANKAKVRKIAGGSAVAATAIASQWPSDDSGIATDDLFSAATDDDSSGMVNPATGLPMLNSCVDVGGNTFGCSNEDWGSNISNSFHDNSFDNDSSISSFSDSSFDDSFSSFDDSFGSSNDDW